MRFKTGNSRFKNFIDLWILVDHLKDPIKLKTAIERCFKRRGTRYDPQEIIALFSDNAFIQQLEQYGHKYYERLKLPKVSVLFASIKIQIDKI